MVYQPLAFAFKALYFNSPWMNLTAIKKVPNGTAAYAHHMGIRIAGDT